MGAAPTDASLMDGGMSINLDSGEASPCSPACATDRVCTAGPPGVGACALRCAVDADCGQDAVCVGTPSCATGTCAEINRHCGSRPPPSPTYCQSDAQCVGTACRGEVQECAIVSEICQIVTRKFCVQVCNPPQVYFSGQCVSLPLPDDYSFGGVGGVSSVGTAGAPPSMMQTGGTGGAGEPVGTSSTSSGGCSLRQPYGTDSLGLSMLGFVALALRRRRMHA
jgi:hypothetical protein